MNTNQRVQKITIQVIPSTTKSYLNEVDEDYIPPGYATAPKNFKIIPRSKWFADVGSLPTPFPKEAPRIISKSRSFCISSHGCLY